MKKATHGICLQVLRIGNVWINKPSKWYKFERRCTKEEKKRIS
jgi:hypothetical protein